MEGVPTTFVLTLALSEQAAADTHHIEFEDIGDARGVGGYVGNFQVLAGSTRRSLSVRFELGVPPQGFFAGVLRFYLCMNADCTTTITGSPFSVPYEATVGFPPPPQVVPGLLTLTSQANDTASADLTVTVTALQASVGVGVGVADALGRFDPQVDQRNVSGQTSAYTVGIRTTPIATPGTYTGNATIFLCNLTPCVLANAIPGSQVTVPYTLVVTPEDLLLPVPSLSGLPEWETFQGTRSHTGYVPVVLNASAFASRWTWVPPDATYWMNPVATGSGKVVVSRSNSFTTVSSLFAIDETSGITAWQHDFDVSGPSYLPEPPAVWGGRVFLSLLVPDSLRGRAKTMQSFDLGSGNHVFSTRTDSQNQKYLAPTVTRGFVYSGGGEFGGINVFNGKTGVRRWFTRLDECLNSTPAVDDNYVYTFGGNMLTVLDRTTTEVYRTFQDINSSCRFRETAPILPGDGSVVMLVPGPNFNDSLFRYDLASATVTWRVAGQFANNPVVANGVVYVVNTESQQLEARSLDAGTFQWSWSLPEPVGRDPSNSPTGNLIVTDNLIFVGTAAGTYAVDLATRTVVWSTIRKGSLAISSNLVLYIATTGYVSSSVQSTGRIDAFDLASGP